MKRIAWMLVLASLELSAFAQTDNVTTTSSTLRELEKVNSSSNYIPVSQYWKEHDIFQHLDVSVIVGTAGIGIDLATPVTEWAQLRLGYEFMPRFTKRMSFEMTINGQPARSYDEDGNRQETRFDKLKEFMYSFTGYDIEDHVDMIGKPTLNNFKFLVDVFPFKNNKHWHFTAGFYWGSSKFAEAVNSTEAMVSLVSAGIYNKMYTSAKNGDPLITFDPNQFPSLSGVGIEMPEEVRKKFLDYGDMGFSVGYFSHDITDADGNVLISKTMVDTKGKTVRRPYIVEPDEDGMVRATASSNSFKPYLGFGYGGNLLKKRNDWKISFDCGAMFWGGTPNLVIYHGLKLPDGTYRDVSLTEDVVNIGGQVGSYVKVFKALKVYPVLSLRVTKRIF
ncbi:MAG: hypothetical protein IJ907_02475 [Prevotella sp.]|jgi:hypothetical protein|nr:hypothetical protein [Prevotella sp.]